MSTEQKKDPWYKRVWNKSKTFIMGLVMTVAPAGASANPTGNASPNSPDAVKVGMNLNANHSKKSSSADFNTLVANLETEVNSFAHQSYMGHKVNFLNYKSHAAGGTFESGNNPCAKTSRYVGVCQLNRDNTLPRFIREYCAKSKHFQSLAKYKTAQACHTKEFDAAWDKVSKGPHAAEFLELQDEALYKYQYDNAFTVLGKTGFFPQINNAQECETPENIVYASGIKSCANQNPLRTPEIYIRAFNDLCVEALAKKGIKAHTNYQNSDWLCYKSAKRGGLKKYHNLVSQAVQDMNKNYELLQKHGISADLSLTNITLQTYKTKKKAFGKMGKRYDENVGEPKLIKDLALFVQKQQDLAMLKGQKEKVQKIEEEKINVSGFYALSPEGFQQQINITSNDMAQLRQKLKESIEGQKVEQLKPNKDMRTKGPFSRLIANAKNNAHRKNLTLAEVKKANERARAALRREKAIAKAQQPQEPQIEGNPPTAEEEVIAMIQKDLSAKKSPNSRKAKQARRNWERFNNDPAYRNAVIQAYKDGLSQQNKV